MIKIAVAGCAGRMGKSLLREALLLPNIQLTGGLVRRGSDSEGLDLGVLIDKAPLGFQATSDLETAFDEADLVIDFTLPEVLMKHLDYYSATGKKCVIGSTGLTQEQSAKLQALGTTNSLVYAPNMSVGMNVCMYLVAQAARHLQTFEVDIVESHHREKRDAPSGTALRLEHIINQERKPDGREVSITSLREDSVVGEHVVRFLNPNEQIEITHHAVSRDLFAQGALTAARWLANKPSGLYSMQDVLDLKF